MISIAEENEGEWKYMTLIEKFNDEERRYMNKSDYGDPWELYLCNYDYCNDYEYKPPITTTKKPSSSSSALPSLPLLMFIILASAVVTL